MPWIGIVLKIGLCWSSERSSNLHFQW